MGAEIRFVDPRSGVPVPVPDLGPGGRCDVGQWLVGVGKDDLIGVVGPSEVLDDLRDRVQCGPGRIAGSGNAGQAVGGGAAAPDPGRLRAPSARLFAGPAIVVGGQLALGRGGAGRPVAVVT